MKRVAALVPVLTSCVRSVDPAADPRAAAIASTGPIAGRPARAMRPDWSQRENPSCRCLCSGETVHEGLKAGEAHAALDAWRFARSAGCHLGADLGDVLGRGAAAAADDVEQAVLCPGTELTGHGVRALLV